MYLMIILWILILGIVLNIAWFARKSLSSYPAPPYPMWWKIWDSVSFAFIFLAAMTIAIFVFINLEPQARFFVDKAPLMLNDINAENFYAGNIIGRTAGEDIPRLQTSDVFLNTKQKNLENIESNNLSLEERVVSRLAVSVCTIEVRKEDVVSTGCFKNTDKGFLYVGGSTGAGRPGRRGSQYFEAGFTEDYLASPLALLGPYTEYYQVTLSNGETIFALFDRYHYLQLQLKGRITLPVGELTYLVVDDSARDILKQHMSTSITDDSLLFIAVSDKYRFANCFRLISAWFSFGLSLFAFSKLKKLINRLIIRK